MIPSCFPVLCSAADSHQAQLQARRLVELGCETLVSFGLAGGLDPSLAAGTLLAPGLVIAPDGSRFFADTSVNFPGAVAMPLAGVDRILATPADKAALFASTGAVAADMESHAVARVAAETGRPFLVLRAVADTSSMTLPGFIADAVTPEGRTRLGPILRGLLNRPDGLPDLILLAFASNKAFAALKQALLYFPRH